MTHGEVVNLLDEVQDSLWDDRRWILAMQAKNPVDAYNKMIAEKLMQQDSVNIDDLTPQERAWLRA